jgi:16S rRNA (cytosine1402-N4)-methyltransferase
MDTPAGAPHAPVLVEEVSAMLDPGRGGLFVDCTVGAGGHTRLLLERGASRVIGIDRDRSALELTRVDLGGLAERVELVHADYRELPTLLAARGMTQVNGILADLGVSSMQLDAEARGFSFRRDERLDMRMDQSTGPTAADLVNGLEEQALADLIYRFGEERRSRRVARAIVAERPFHTTGELARVVRRAVAARGHQRIDPATRTFQALRIAVNRELEGLEGFIGDASRHLAPGGRLAVISFHSLEDRPVKHTMRALAASDASLTLLTRKPIVATIEERARNPRSRSAKLRGLARQ